MDKKDLKRKITSRTKVIVHTTLYGIIEDISEVLSIAKENNLLVFEDCAQGFGTQINHQFGGLRGDAGVFSFGALKNVNGLFGGALFIKDKTVFERVEKFNKSLPLLSITKLLRKYLFCLSYEVITHPWIYNVFSRSIMKKFDELGHVDKDAKIKFEIPKESLVQLTSLQAKLILHSLKRFKKEQGRSNIFGLNLLTQIEDIPKIGYEHKYLQYPVVLKDRNTIIKNYMRDLGIDVNIDFFRDLNSLDCFKQYRSSCPNVGHMIHHLVLFPTYSRQSKAYNELVCLELKKRANSS